MWNATLCVCVCRLYALNHYGIPYVPLTFGRIITGARGSWTSFTFRLVVVTASDVGGVAAGPGVWPEVWPGGVGDV